MKADVYREKGSRIPALDLVAELCRSLNDEQVNYCHWKSNAALDRSARGDNDLDLLVSRSDTDRFHRVLHALHFKQARKPAEMRIFGISNYFGYDEASDKIVHVHAHYQLIIGHDMAKEYRLPIEKAYLESAVQEQLFRVPAPELEFIVFVIRMVLKHSTWDTVFTRDRKMKKSESGELDFLRARSDPARVREALLRLLPQIGTELFDSCVRTLEPGCGPWERLRTARRVERVLESNARRKLLALRTSKHLRRVRAALRRRISKSGAKCLLETGGARIAIVGGDGSGKTTVIEGLRRWLSKCFETNAFHMGKPGWSGTTYAIRGFLKAGRLLGLDPTVESGLQETVPCKSFFSPGYPLLLRAVCRARDRYRTYVKAERFAAGGGLAIFDRFPVPQLLMDGPRAEWFLTQCQGEPAGRFLRPDSAGRLTKFLLETEKNYYRRIAGPELLIVLRVDPETAVIRKVDEDPRSVRQRTAEVWNADWNGSGAVVLDASLPKAEVLARVKSILWSAL